MKASPLRPNKLSPEPDLGAQALRSLDHFHNYPALVLEQPFAIGLWSRDLLSIPDARRARGPARVDRATPECSHRRSEVALLRSRSRYLGDTDR